MLHCDEGFFLSQAQSCHNLGYETTVTVASENLHQDPQDYFKWSCHSDGDCWEQTQVISYKVVIYNTYLAPAGSIRICIHHSFLDVFHAVQLSKLHIKPVQKVVSEICVILLSLLFLVSIKNKYLQDNCLRYNNIMLTITTSITPINQICLGENPVS